MSISFEHFPIAVAGDECYLFYSETRFKQSACGFMPQIVEMKIVNFQFLASSPECRADGWAAIRKNPLALAGETFLLFQYGPRVNSCGIQ